MALSSTGVVFVAKDFDPFSRTIKKADKLVNGFNKSLDGLTKGYSSLEKAQKKYLTQQKKIDQQATQSVRKIQTLSTGVGKLGTGMQTTTAQTQGAASQLARFESAQDRVAASSATMADNIRRANSNLRSLNSNVRSGDLAQLGSGVSSSGRGLITLSDGLRAARTQLVSLGNEAVTAGNKLGNLGVNVGSNIVKGVAALTVAGGVALAGTIATATSFESAFTGVAKTTDGLVELTTDGYLELTEAGDNFKDGLEGLTAEIPSTFEELAGIAELGGQLGFAAGAEDADEAQRILLDFTETVAGLAEATNLTAEAAARDLSRFANIFSADFEDPGENIVDLGNTVVLLGNRFATSEKEIVSFATRLAGAGKTSGLTQAEVLGISAAFSSIGIRAQAGGTAVSTALLEMQKAANVSESGIVDNSDAVEENQRKLRDLRGEILAFEANSGLSADALLAQQDAFVAAGGSIASFGEQLGDTRQRRLLGMAEDMRDLTLATNELERTHGQPFDSNILRTFLEVTGTTADEFRALQKDDPAGLFQKLIEGISAQGDEAGATLEALGLNTSQARQAFLGMAQNTDLLEDALSKANAEFDDGNALQEEVEKRFATTESRMQLFRNQLRLAGEDIGVRFLPFVNDMLGVGGDIASVFGETVPGVLDAVSLKLGELTGIELGEFDAPAAVEAAMNGLITAIDEFDVTPIQNGITLLTDTVFPAFMQGVNFVTENWEVFEAILIGLGTAGGILVTISTLASIAAGIGLLLSPLGLAVIAVTGFSTAWNLNLFGVRDATQEVFGTISENITGLIDAFKTDGTQGVFEFLKVPEGLQDNITQALSPFSDFELPESIANLQDNISDLFSGESMTALTEAATTITTALFDVGVAVAGFGATVAVSLAGSVVNRITALVDALGAVVGIVDGFLEGDTDQVKEELSNLSEAILGFTLEPIENIAGLIFGEDIDLVTPVNDALTSAAGAVTEFLWPGLPEIPELPEISTEALTGFAWPELPEFVWPELPSIPQDFLDTIKAPFGDIDVDLGPLETIRDNLRDLFSGESGEKLQAGADAIVGAVTTLGGLALDDLISKGESLATFGLNVTGVLVALGATAVATFVEQATEVAKGVGAIIGLVDAILDSSPEEAAANLKILGESLLTIATAPIENIGELLTGEDLDFVTPIQNALDGLTGLVFPELPSLTNILSGNVEGADFIPDFVTPIQTGLNALTGLLLPNVPAFTLLSNLLDTSDAPIPDFNTVIQTGLNALTGLLLPNVPAFTLLSSLLDTSDAPVPDFNTVIQTGLDALTTLALPNVPAFTLLSSLLDTSDAPVPDFNTVIQTGLDALTTLALPNVPAFTLLSSLLDTSDAPVPDFNTVVQQGLDKLSELTIPELPDLLTPFTNLKDQILGVFEGLNPFSGLDFSLPELPEGLTAILPERVADLFAPDEDISLAPTITVDPDVDTEAINATGNEVGQAINEGIASGVEESEETLIGSIGSTMSGAWDATTGFFGIDSPSTLGIELGGFIGQGIAIGITGSGDDFVMPAIEQLNLLVNTGLQAMADTLMLSTTPSLESFTFVLDNLSFITLPTVTSLINEGLIPAKQNLASVNFDSVVPSVEAVTEAENNMATEIEVHVIPALSSQIDIMQTAVSQSKKLDKALKNLIARYKALAAAIAAAKRAGSGVPGGVTGNEPVGSPAGTPPPFASGGNFTVPNVIPPEITGPTGGMLVEVHAGEEVTVLPRSIAQQPQDIAPVAAPQFSGAGFVSEAATSSTTNQTSNQTFVLNVKEAVSPTFSGGFGLLKSLGPSRGF